MTYKHANNEIVTLEHLWQFSLQYYSATDVKEACLNLQNHCSGNVNLLLVLKYLDECKTGFDETGWQILLAALQHTDSLISHYRELRKKMKGHLPDTLYRQALEFELELEKQQQSDLVTCVNALSLTPVGKTSLTEQYCERLGAHHLIDYFNRPFEAKKR
jgi:uncharacterized protein (TIGR02444 family)